MQYDPGTLMCQKLDSFQMNGISLGAVPSPADVQSVPLMGDVRRC